MSSQMRSPGPLARLDRTAQGVGGREDLDDEFEAVPNAHPPVDAVQVGADGGEFEAQCFRDPFIPGTAHDQPNHPLLLGGQPELGNHRVPGLRIQRQHNGLRVSNA